MGSLVHFRRRKRCGDVVAGITSRSETRSWSWRKSIGVTSALRASTVTFGSQLVRGRRSANRADCPPCVDRTEYSRAREKWSKRAEMRDTLSGILSLSDRVKAQHHHKTMWNTLTTTKSTSSYPVHLVESHTFQIACVSGLLEGPSIPTNLDCFTSILDLAVAYFVSRPLNSQKSNGSLESFRRGSSHVPPSHH